MENPLSALKGNVGGVPKPALAIAGVGGLAFFLWKRKKSSASTTTPAPVGSTAGASSVMSSGLSWPMPSGGTTITNNYNGPIPQPTPVKGKALPPVHPKSTPHPVTTAPHQIKKTAPKPAKAKAKPVHAVSKTPAKLSPKPVHPSQANDNKARGDRGVVGSAGQSPVRSRMMGGRGGASRLGPLFGRSNSIPPSRLGRGDGSDVSGPDVDNATPVSTMAPSADTTAGPSFVAPNPQTGEMTLASIAAARGIPLAALVGLNPQFTASQILVPGVGVRVA